MSGIKQLPLLLQHNINISFGTKENQKSRKIKKNMCLESYDFYVHYSHIRGCSQITITIFWLFVTPPTPLVDSLTWLNLRNFFMNVDI